MTKILKYAAWAYVAAALLTFLFQVYVRLGQCTGFGPCAISLVKGAVWSAVWPIYWPVAWF